MRPEKVDVPFFNGLQGMPPRDYVQSCGWSQPGSLKWEVFRTMVKCPFCNFENEDGALFCEQCKSDVGAVVAQPAHSSEPVPMAAVIEDLIPLEGSIPVAAPIAMPEPLPLPAMQLAEPVAAAPAPAPAAAPAAKPPEAGAPAAEAGKLPPDAKPKLVVLRGQKINMEFPIYEGPNFVGRADEKPVDIDLEDQEPPDRVWCSRQHAVINLENSVLLIEDLNSANGTYVNRNRVYPGQKKQLNVNDVIQIGTVQMKVKI
jgi:hypothetical protein